MIERTIYALGFFDGVHLGHQALLKACRHLADRTDCSTGVVTFGSHPDTLVVGKTPRLINTVADRQRILLGYSMERITVLPFDEKLMQMPWRDFIRMLRGNPYNAVGFVCGSDFRFGYKGEGTAEILQEYCKAAGMPYAVVAQQEIDGIRISSTHIRTLLVQGEMEQAVRFLGHPHILTGQVIAGRQLGRTIGTPTANLLLPEDVVVPRFGVYACKVTVDGKVYQAVTNIGTRPTVSGEGVTVEVHLLDFDGDLYGKTLCLAFYHFLRPEQKFESLAELKTQIAADIIEVRTTLESSM